MKKIKQHSLSNRTIVMLLASYLLGAPALAQDSTDQLPNLVALPAGDISIAENYAGDPELRFSGSSWNAGSGALELIAGGVAQGRQNVYQRIYQLDGSYRDVLAGNFEWHQGHSHFHFDDYAIYLLQPIKGKSKRTSTKTSFCIMDTDAVDTSLPGAPEQAFYSQCGNAAQGMSVGWSDTYGSHLDGQSISLRRLKDGDYRLMVEADPENRILETNENDNVSCVLLRIFSAGRSLDILNADGCELPDNPGGGGARVDSILPTTGLLGATVPVEISGTGFYEGIPVRFDAGSGARLTLQDPIVIGANRISGMLEIKKKGRLLDPVWDLHVGDAVLQDAFSVSE